MNTPNLTRRRIMEIGSAAPLMLMLGACSSGQDESAAACVDPSQLTSGERSLRTTVRYNDRAANAQESCVTCAFFHPESAGAGCGRCDILSGTVSATGHCTSWSAKT